MATDRLSNFKLATHNEIKEDRDYAASGLELGDLLKFPMSGVPMQQNRQTGLTFFIGLFVRFMMTLL